MQFAILPTRINTHLCVLPSQRPAVLPSYMNYGGQVLLCANPTSLQLNHFVNTDTDNIKNLILATQKYLLLIHNARKRYGKPKPGRTSNPRTEDTVPVRSNLLPPPGSINNSSNHPIQSRQTDIRSFGTNINGTPSSTINNCNSLSFQFDNLQDSWSMQMAGEQSGQMAPPESHQQKA